MGGGLVPGSPKIPRSVDAQVPYIKWCSAVSPPYPWVLHGFSQRILWEQSPWIGMADCTLLAHQWRKRPNGSGTLNLGVPIIYSSTLFQGVYCVNWKPPDFEWGLEAKGVCGNYRVQCMLPCHLGLGTCRNTVLEISVLGRCWIKHLASSHRRTTVQTLSTLELGYVLLAFFIWQLYSSWKAASALLTGH